MKKFLMMMLLMIMLLLPVMPAYSQYVPMPVPRMFFLGDTTSSGVVLAGGKLCTYQAGTLVPQATYTDASGATPNSNPVVLDSAGFANIWLKVGWTYKFILYDNTGTANTCSGNQQWIVDNVGAAANSNLTGPGTISGSFSGNPTFTGNPGFTGSPTMSLTSNIAIKPTSADNEQFVSSNSGASDSNDGFSWGSARADWATALASFSAIGGVVNVSGLGATLSANPYSSLTAKASRTYLGSTTITTNVSLELDASGSNGNSIFGIGRGTTGGGYNTTILAGGGFPSNSSVVQLSGTTTVSYGNVISDLAIDCNNVSGCTALQNLNGQEETRAANVALLNFVDYGLEVGSSTANTGYAQNSGPYSNLEVLCGSGAVSGTIPIIIQASAAEGFRGIDGATINCSGSSTHPTTGLSINAPGGTYRNIHVEGVSTSGVYVNASDVTLININCTGAISSMTSCINIASGVQGITIVGVGVGSSGVTNVIYDQTNSYTLTKSAEGQYVGLYAFGAGSSPVPLLTTSFSAAPQISKSGILNYSLLQSQNFQSSLSTACAAANISLGTGWGTSASVSASTSSGNNCVFTITSGSGSFSSAPTFTDTLANGFASATPCAVFVKAITGSGGAIMFDNTTPSATAPVFTAYTSTGAAFTPSTSETYKIQVSCGP